MQPGSRAYGFSWQMAAFRAVAKLTQAAYGRNSRTPRTSTRTAVTMKAMIEHNKSTMSASAGPGARRRKKIKDHRKFSPSCIHQHVIAARLPGPAGARWTSQRHPDHHVERGPDRAEQRAGWRPGRLADPGVPRGDRRCRQHSGHDPDGQAKPNEHSEPKKPPRPHAQNPPVAPARCDSGRRAARAIRRSMPRKTSA